MSIASMDSATVTIASDRRHRLEPTARTTSLHQPASQIRLRLRPEPELREAVDRAIGALLPGFGPDGKLMAGCESRPLESALTLHLLRGIAHRGPEVDRLAGYCERSHRNPDGSPQPADPCAIDVILSRMAVLGVLDRKPEPAELQIFQRVLDGFAHPTQRRKAALFGVLLAELGLTPQRLLDIPVGIRGDEPYHLWTRLTLSAARILNLSSNGRSSEADPAEIQFLLAHQSRDGSWEQHLLLTILALLALDRCGHGREAFELGLRRLLGQMRPDGGIPFITDEDVWVTCLAAYVLSEAGAPRHRLEAAARYLAGCQSPDGGWAYAEGVVQSDADCAALAVMFLRRQDPDLYEKEILCGERYLLELQGADGGVPTFVHGAAADVEITAKAVRAWSCPWTARREPTRRALRWLASSQQPDGGFRTEWKICSTYPVFHVLAALRDTRSPPSGTEMLRLRCVQYLRRHQNADGGWGRFPGETQSHPLSTAYAVAGLAHAASAEGLGALRRGARYLAARQHEDGRFESSPDSLGPRPLIYDVKVLPTIYGLWALSSARRALVAAGSQHGALR